MKTLKLQIEEDELNDVIIKLRWGSQYKPNIKISCYSYKIISKIVGKSETFCRKIALDYLCNRNINPIIQGILSRKKKTNLLSN